MKVFWIFLALSYGLIRVLVFRMITKMHWPNILAEETEWTFSQVTPILRLLGPICVFIEALNA